ncbi:MAG: aryl-sulfate sulfotransferase [Flavobacteriales bacterium]
MKLLRFFPTALFVVTFQAAFAQPNTVGTIAYNPELYSEGYTLIYPHNQPHARLINACGEIVHIWENDSLRRPGNSAYLTPNGGLVWSHRSAFFQNDPLWAGGGGAVIEGRTWDNEVQWSYELNDSTGRLHHDFTLTNTGTILAIAWERIDSLAAVDAGRNPGLLEGGEIWSERIIELQPNASGGADVIWEWRVWDHLVQDFDSTKTNFGVVSEAPNKVNVNFGTPSVVAPDWLHMNSIDYHPGLNQIMVSVPTFDEIWIINKNAPENGLVWRWGNPEAFGMGTSEDQQLHYQHAATWLDAPYHQGSPDFGKIGVFNNRNPGQTGPYSSVHLINPAWNEANEMYTTIENGSYAPEEFDWTWTAPTPTDFFSSGLSNFERLPNGNNLVLGGRTGEIFEFTPSGDTAWYYRVPIQAGSPVSQGTELGMNDNLLFRSVRYPAQFPAFNGVDLEPMGVWELDPAPPLPACLPCDLALEVTPFDQGAYANVTGANGDYTITWMLDDVNLCVGDSLTYSTSSDCSDAIQNLVEGDLVTAWVVDSLGCEAFATFNWVITNVEENSQMVRVFPNPTDAFCTIQGQFFSSYVHLYSLTGQHVRALQINPAIHTQSIDLSGLQSGLYILAIDDKRIPLVIAP